MAKLHFYTFTLFVFLFGVIAALALLAWICVDIFGFTL